MSNYFCTFAHFFDSEKNMMTNTHILTLSKQFEELKQFLDCLPLSVDKQRLGNLLEAMNLQLFCVDRDMQDAYKRIGELSAENYGAVITAQEGHTYFCHITPQCISKQMASHVENHLREDCKGSARVLWQTIHEYEMMSYLKTENLSAEQIYRDLKNYFGPLKFSERTFRMYRYKAAE